MGLLFLRCLKHYRKFLPWALISSASILVGCSFFGVNQPTIIEGTIWSRPDTCNSQPFVAAVSENLDDFFPNMRRTAAMTHLRLIALRIFEEDLPAKGCRFELDARYPMRGTQGTIALKASFEAAIAKEAVCVNFHHGMDDLFDDPLAHDVYPWKNIPTGNKANPTEIKFDAPCFDRLGAIVFFDSE